MSTQRDWALNINGYNKKPGTGVIIKILIVMITILWTLYFMLYNMTWPLRTTVGDKIGPVP